MLPHSRSRAELRRARDARYRQRLREGRMSINVEIDALGVDWLVRVHAIDAGALAGGFNLLAGTTQLRVWITLRVERAARASSLLCPFLPFSSGTASRAALIAFSSASACRISVQAANAVGSRSAAGGEEEESVSMADRSRSPDLDRIPRF
jgi:hypothetical protein